jgi:ligand-binding sensor domain-containing protein
LLALDADKRWRPVDAAGPWSTANALWVSAAGAWVLESETHEIHHHDGARWQSSPSPTKAPRALWSADDGALWLGGDDGLFRQHGSEWRKVSALSGSVLTITGRGAGDVWVGGSAGLFQSRAR